MKDISRMKIILPNMSNCYHTIDVGCDPMLRGNPGKCRCYHFAWNFCGSVWFEDGKFHEQVWQYNSPVKEISANSLEELIEKVNDKFGEE